MAPKVHGLNVVILALTADLADLQQNLTAVLAAALDKDNRCSDRLQIQDATITPIEPASLVVVQLHYERWACVKLFGKQQVQKLIGGNAVIQVKLTPSVQKSPSCSSSPNWGRFRRMERSANFSARETSANSCAIKFRTPYSPQCKKASTSAPFLPGPPRGRNHPGRPLQRCRRRPPNRHSGWRSPNHRRPAPRPGKTIKEPPAVPLKRAAEENPTATALNGTSPQAGKHAREHFPSQNFSVSRCLCGRSEVNLVRGAATPASLRTLTLQEI